MQHARDRIRFLTMRARLAAPVEQVVAEVNRFLRGWAGYYRFGNSARLFDKIRKLRPHAARAVRRRAASAFTLLGVRPGLPVPGHPGSDLAQRNRRRSQGEPVLAIEIVWNSNAAHQAPLPKLDS